MTYTYDIVDDLLAEASPDRGTTHYPLPTTHYRYDADGNLTQQ